MTVLELITRLKALPGDASVFLLYDGALRREIDVVWEATSGAVGVGGRDEPVYDDDDRPVGAPSENDNPYWRISV